MEPWKPVKYTDAVAYSIKALAAGNANDEQQRMALHWIVTDLCGTYDVTYFSESQRDSDFAQGKRWPGQQIVKLINLPPEAFGKRRPGRPRKNT